MTPHQQGMHTGGQATVWDTEDDFDDEPAQAAAPASPAATGQPIFGDYDDFDDVPTPSAPPAPRAPAPAGPTPAGRKATSATATPIATSTSVDDGVQFGNDPDFDFVGSQTYGAVFDIPGAADILRTSQRADTQPRRGRGRTATLDREPEVAGDIVPSILDSDPPAATDDRKAAREERIAASRAKRAHRAEEAKQKREERAAERAEQRKAKSADRAVKKLAAESSDTAHDPRRKLLLAGAALAVVAAAGATVLAFTGGDDPQPAGTEPQAVIAGATSSPAADTAAPATADADCPTQTAGKVFTGRDAGDPTSGVGAIKAFNYAYYTDRDAAAASARVLPSSAKTVIGSQADLQRAIDKVPAGTTHCLTITDRGNDLYATELTQIPPGGGAPEVYRQLIQTVRDNNTSVITSITATY